jgi:hypothetical protein
MTITSTTKTVLVLLVSTIALRCGGMIVGGDASDATTADATADVVDAGTYTACTTPEGYEICGTPVALPQCPSSAADCEQCGCDILGIPPSEYCINLCAPTIGALNDAGWLKRGCDQWCDGSDICFRLALGSYSCVPFSIGQLLSQYEPDAPNDTYRNLVRYGDLSAWTGQAISSAPTCPAVSGYELCCGACGACGSGDICAGRSPLHPWGVCVPEAVPNGQHQGKGDAGFNGPTVCTPSIGEGVFVFTVDAPSQDVAALYGRCMPIAMCQALAASFPGGGTCTPQ